MTDPVIWPRGILCPRNCDSDPVPMTIAGPPSLSGFTQTVSSPAARWRIVYEACRVSGQHRLTWRALQVQVDGRATALVIPIYDRDELRAIAAGFDAGASRYGDGTRHDDGTGFFSPRGQVILTTDLARGAVTAVTTAILGPGLQPGQHFSIGHRLYRCATIEAVDGADTTITFWPPARDAAAAGAECEVDRPVCKVRLADDMGLALKLDTGRYGLPNVTFLEDPS